MVDRVTSTIEMRSVTQERASKMIVLELAIVIATVWFVCCQSALYIWFVAVISTILQNPNRGKEICYSMYIGLVVSRRLPVFGRKRMCK